MELSKKQINATKGVAIIFMLTLHLFCTRIYNLYNPVLWIGNVPLMYYIALFGDCCVVIYCFCSGYGLMINYNNDRKSYVRKNIKRIRNFYINYWVVIVLFVIFIGVFLDRGLEFPGKLSDLFLTITAIDPKYNGAWWFVSTYIILVIISPILNKVIKTKNNYVVLAISFVFYSIAYVQRIKTPIVFNVYILDLIVKQIALLGTSQLPFIIGGIFSDKKIYSKINIVFSKFKFKNIICILGILFMGIAHGVVQTLFVAIFTGIGFIILFNLIDKVNWIDNVFSYLGKHSTNLWLTHMFFYMIYFKNFIYSFKYSILIIAALVICCLLSSYIIGFINGKIIKLIDRRKLTLVK